MDVIVEMISDDSAENAINDEPTDADAYEGVSYSE